MIVAAVLCPYVHNAAGTGFVDQICGCGFNPVDQIQHHRIIPVFRIHGIDRIFSVFDGHSGGVKGRMIAGFHISRIFFALGRRMPIGTSAALDQDFFNIFRFNVVFRHQFDSGLDHTHGGGICTYILKPGAEDPPSAPVHRFFKIYAGKQCGAVTMVAFNDTHGACKALFCHNAGFDGVPSHKSHTQVFRMEIFFIIGIQYA